MINNRIAVRRPWASIRAHISIVRLALLAKGSRSRLKQGPLLLAVLLTLSTPSMPTVPATTTRLDAHWGEMPLYFIANQGQMDSRIAFYVQGSDKTLYFTREGVTFALTSPPSPLLVREGRRGEERGRWIVKLDFVGANSVRPSGQAQTEAVISYFKGSPDEWHAGLPTYSKIAYPDLWQGIDLVYSGTVNRLKHEFVVRPGADPARIRLAYRGASVRVNESGQLEVSTPAGGFQDDAPIAYQEVAGQRVPVAVSFAMDNAVPFGADGLGMDEPRPYGFHVGAYDPGLPLVIDPTVLLYCGYIGGDDDDYGTAIAVDSAGNAYVTGSTNSTEATFPVTVGPDLTYNGLCCPTIAYDAFVAKVKADGTGLVYAGYIGGEYNDWGTGIAVDSEGNAYVTGDTESTEATFPVTVGPDLTNNGGYDGPRDAFVAKVNADGTGLVYCGYIGGSGDEGSEGIAVDSTGNAYVTGITGSSQQEHFPVTVGPDVTYNGLFDAFVAKVRADGTGFAYAGYIGGGSTEFGTGIAVDSEGNAYVTGYTDGDQPGFPVTVGPDLSYNGGYWDAFVAKVKADGTGLAYAGYIGGIGYDGGEGIAVDSLGNAYVTGMTDSFQTTFPVTGGPDLTYNLGERDAFVAKVKADGTGLAYAGYIGGVGWDYGYGIAVDSAGNAYVTGMTNSTEETFPVIDGPDLTDNGYYDDAFVAKVKADGTGLVYAGYIGANDWGRGIAVDSAGNAYVTGAIGWNDETFAVIGPDLTYNGGNGDAFVAKISATTPSFDSYLVINNSSGAPGSFFTVTGFDFPPNSTATIAVNGNTLGTVPVNSSGGLVFLLETSPTTDEGFYRVTASGFPGAMTHFTLDVEHDVRPQEGSGTVFVVPDGIAHDVAYLPLIASKSYGSFGR